MTKKTRLYKQLLGYMEKKQQQKNTTVENGFVIN